MEISIQKESNRQSDGHGEAHLQANGAYARKLFIELSLILLHWTQAPGLNFYK